MPTREEPDVRLHNEKSFYGLHILMVRVYIDVQDQSNKLHMQM